MGFHIKSRKLVSTLKQLGVLRLLRPEDCNHPNFLTWSYNMNRLLLIALLLGSVWNLPPAFATSPDEETIRNLLSATFDRPDARVVADPIAISGDYAIVGWTQSEKGGRALLRREGGDWAIVACAGDDFKIAAHLEHAGIPRQHARRLAELQEVGESRVPEERLKLFSTFGPTVGFEGHPPAKH